MTNNQGLYMVGFEKFCLCMALCLFYLECLFEEDMGLF